MLPRPFCFPGVFLPLLFLVATLRAQDDTDTGPPRLRTLHVTILTPDGHPAPGVWVTLKGLDRDAFTDDYSDEPKKSTSPWRFHSDAHGQFTVRFGRFRTYGSKALMREFFPGWGGYHLYADGPRFGSAVSRRIVNPNDSKINYATGDWGATEWGGHTLFLKRASSRITMRFERGLRLTGRVLDTDGHPLSNVEVSEHHDLGADTHTGHGGEILQKSTTTGAHGEFAISHIHPNRFYISIGPDRGCWVRTRIRHRWASEILDEITPRSGEALISMRIVMSKEPLYLYRGKVTAPDGSPIANAKVGVNISRHRFPSTWEDDHNWQSTDTDAEGKYEIKTESRFADSMSVESPGYVRAWKDYAEGPHPQLAPPGEYNFTLVRAPDESKPSAGKTASPAQTGN